MCDMQKHKKAMIRYKKRHLIDFSNQKILVIGDVILDEYIEGSVTRVSPEAPIPILDKKKQYYRLGGATNVARNLSSLGAKVWLIGRIGDDPAGLVIKNLLSLSKINIDLLMKDTTVPTSIKTRFISENHQLLRVDYENKTSVEENLEFKEALHANLDRHMRYFDAIIISDYNKGVVYPELLQHISCLQKQYKKIVTADTHKTDLELFRHFTAITPNLTEFAILGKDKYSHEINQLKFRGAVIRTTYELETLLITMSSQGVCLFSDDGVNHLSAEKQDIVDVTGAGDTVIAVYTLALSVRMKPLDAAKLANKAAGIVVSKMGTAVVTPEELCS